MLRRQFLNASAIGLSVGLLSACSQLVRSPRTVYLNYTQAELDDAYNQDIWAHPGFQKTIDSYGSISRDVKSRYSYSTKKYGAKTSEALDIFSPPASENAPIHIFIHGGAWRMLSKDTSAGPAPVFVDHGGIYIALNFDNIPETNLAGMIEQCRRAISWVYHNATDLGGDPSRITLSGHSSGAHLAAVMITTDWRPYQAPSNLIKGAVLISGMCDLTAPMKSFRGGYLNLSPEEIHAYSPVNFVSTIKCPVLVAWGEHESPEFKRQSTTFAKALYKAGRLDKAVMLRGLDHLEAVLELNDPKSQISIIALKQMGLSSG